MKQKFNWGITTKLLLVNAVIFATIGAIIFVVHNSFNRIEESFTTLFTIVENMQMLTAQILRATQEQQQGTFHVTELMDGVTTQVGQSTPTVKQLAQLANELASQAEILKKQVEQFIIPDTPL